MQRMMLHTRAGGGLKHVHMLIDYYKAIEDSSAKMLEAAKLKDWDGGGAL